MKSKIGSRKGYAAIVAGVFTALVALAAVATFGTDSRPVQASQAAPEIAAAEVPSAAAAVQLHKYMIPRTVPGAEGFSAAQLKDVSAASNEILRQMRDEGKQIYWLESFVGKDTITCVYIASGSELLYEHAKRGSFPVNSVIEVTRMIEPATGQ